MALSPVEHLIAYLYIVERDRGRANLVIDYMEAAGFGSAVIKGAWAAARHDGLTRHSGLGQDRLSSAGRAKAPSFAAEVEGRQESDEPDPPPNGVDKAP